MYSLTCDEPCEITVYMKPLWVKTSDGVCFIVPNICALKNLQCKGPEHGFYQVTDGSCGTMPDAASHNYADHEEL